MSPTPDQTAFLLLHGYQHHQPPGHWLRWLADELAAAGSRVRYPQLPDPDHPDVTAWLATLRGELHHLAGSRVTVVCHSLGGLLWLRGASLNEASVVDRALLVAPPDPEIVLRDSQIAAIARFDVIADQIAQTPVHSTRIVASDNDPYCPACAGHVFAEPLGTDYDLLAGQGHLDLAAGYGPWPSVLAWCRRTADRVGPRTPGPKRPSAHPSNRPTHQEKP